MKELVLLNRLGHPEVPPVAANNRSLYLFTQGHWDTVLSIGEMPAEFSWRRDGRWFYRCSEFQRLKRKQ